MHESIRTQGVIVGIKESDGNYAPFFEFHDTEGIEHRVTANLWSSSVSYKAGDAVEVLYRLSWPQYACINSFEYLWDGPLMALIFSIALWLAAILYLRGGSFADS